MAVLTPAEFRESFLEGLSGTTEDTKIAKFISRASRLIAKYLGYPPASAGVSPSIESTSYTRHYGEEAVEQDGLVLRLDVLPVLSVTSIYDDMERVFGADTLVAATDYELLADDAVRGLVTLKGVSTHGAWDQGYKNVRVVFTAGWSTNTVPDDLVEAHGLLTRWLWQKKKTFGLRNTSEGGVSISLDDPAAIPEEIRQILDPYRLPGAIL